MSWINVKDRIPTDAETFDGRVPCIDTEGILRWALLAGPQGEQFLVSDWDVDYWMVPPAHPNKDVKC